MIVLLCNMRDSKGKDKYYSCIRLYNGSFITINSCECNVHVNVSMMMILTADNCTATQVVILVNFFLSNEKCFQNRSPAKCPLSIICM